MVNIIQHTHQLYNATNMIDTDLNKWFSGDGEPLYRWRMIMQKQEKKEKRVLALIIMICPVTSLQSREYPKSQMTGDVLSLSGPGLIWALREMGWNRFIKFLSFLRSPADPDHLIPSPVMMITIRNSESRPINCGVSKHCPKNELLGE